MVSAASPTPRRRWQKVFVEKMLPAIIRHAKIAFRHVRGQDRQDKVQETVANALVAFRRLVQLKKTDLAYRSGQRADRRVGGAKRAGVPIALDRQAMPASQLVAEQRRFAGRRVVPLVHTHELQAQLEVIALRLEGIGFFDPDVLLGQFGKKEADVRFDARIRGRSRMR